MRCELKFFRANDREDEIGDQAECDDTDDGVFHGECVLDFFAGPNECDHQGKEADGGEEIEDISHSGIFSGGMDE